MNIVDADADYIEQSQWENHSHDEDCCTKCTVLGAAECELLPIECVLNGGTKIAQGFPTADCSRPTTEDIKDALFSMMCMAAEGQRESKSLKRRARKIIYG